MNEEERARDDATLIRLRIDDAVAPFMSVSDDGVIDIPISVVRQLADWVRRYDMRPKSSPPPRFHR